MRTKTEIQTALDELAVLYGERDSIEAKRERKLKKHRAAFEQAAQPINDKIQTELAPVNQRIYALESDVRAAILTAKKPDGEFKFRAIESSDVKAEVVRTAGQREVAAETFFNSVPALQRHGESFWACFKVQIAKAEKFLGEKLDEIAEIKESFRVDIKRN